MCYTWLCNGIIRCSVHGPAGCEDNYIIALANEVRKVLNEYGWLLQDFEDVKLRQSLEDGKLLTTYEKSFDNRQLLQKCVRIVS